MAIHIRRREFIFTLGGAAGRGRSWRARAADAVIGFLRSASAASSAHLVAAFRQGLVEAGFAEGRNVSIEFRFAENRDDLLPALAADLIRRKVAVVVGIPLRRSRPRPKRLRRRSSS